MPILDTLFVLLSLFFLAQGTLNLVLSLYAWGAPGRLEEAKSPESYNNPRVSFSVLLPARHEKAVIGETILGIAKANYPKELIEILVICDDSDTETITAARAAIESNGISNARVITYNQLPINKQHGLNVGLHYATKVSTVIFDAEDSVSSDIFNIANTLFYTKDADVIQAGVQLMNYDSRWFSSHNVLEYYFWFRSRMHFHTKIGMVPLGGNSAFFITEQLRMMGGWNEAILTEDADIGIRLSTRGAKIVSTYDPRHVTKEETPLTVKDFIKQRTRWNQGFMQILHNKDWLRYETFTQRFFCLYILAFPYVQSVMSVFTILDIIFGIEFKVPVLISLLAFTPLLILLAQVVVNCLGLYEFSRGQQIKLKWWIMPWMIVTFFAYQALLSIGALRAAYRQIRGQYGWEKTTHSGMHRAQVIGVREMDEVPA
jgi:cellulose synthase/poly-beta-1,6-N-acetylglucosamine synthase-like glycosyltransferase